jgi:hypothetical protein
MYYIDTLVEYKPNFVDDIGLLTHQSDEFKTNCSYLNK